MAEGSAGISEIENATMRSVTLRVLPFLMICYFVAFIDRVNAGFAAFEMNADIGLTPAMFGLGGGLFFVTYVLFEVPSNLAGRMRISGFPELWSRGD